MTDIVERLRTSSTEFTLDSGWVDAEREEAATEIARLRAKVAKADALRAENERLRMVLRRMVGGRVYVPGYGMAETSESCAARAALKGKDT